MEDVVGLRIEVVDDGQQPTSAQAAAQATAVPTPGTASSQPLSPDAARAAAQAAAEAWMNAPFNAPHIAAGETATRAEQDAQRRIDQILHAIETQQQTEHLLRTRGLDKNGRPIPTVGAASDEEINAPTVFPADDKQSPGLMKQIQPFMDLAQVMGGGAFDRFFGMVNRLKTTVGLFDKASGGAISGLFGGGGEAASAAAGGATAAEGGAAASGAAAGLGAVAVAAAPAAAAIAGVALATGIAYVGIQKLGEAAENAGHILAGFADAQNTQGQLIDLTERYFNAGGNAAIYGGLIGGFLMAGPVGAVIGGAAGILSSATLDAGMKVIRAYDEVTGAWLARGRQLAQYSPDLAVSTTMRDVRSIFADIKEANELGPSIARMTDQQSRIENSLREILLPIKKTLTETLANLMENIANKLSELEKIATATNVLGQTLGAAFRAAMEHNWNKAAGLLKGLNQNIIDALNHQKDLDNGYDVMNMIDQMFRGGPPIPRFDHNPAQDNDRFNRPRIPLAEDANPHPW